MNFDFVAMNLTGFLFYGIYNTYGYFVDSKQTGLVDINDIVFCYHALFATLLTIFQICIYPRRHNRIHFYTVVLLVSMWAFVGAWATLTLHFGVISFLGYFKLAISTLKYLPQFYWNYKRKSTKGWSIFNIIMDFIGGSFSFGQMGLEKIFGQDVQVNYIKLGLGLMVVVYDCGFMIQHYCLYPQGEQKDPQKQNYSLFTEDSNGSFADKDIKQMTSQAQQNQLPQPQPNTENENQAAK